MVKKILIISLSNIGDVVLSFPVIDILLRDFPQAEISIVVGPKGESLLKANPKLKEVIVYDKRETWWRKFRWVSRMGWKGYDMIVDLRHTMIPVFIPARYKTSYFRQMPKNLHMRDKHLEVLRRVHPFTNPESPKQALYISPEAEANATKIFSTDINNQRFVAIAPGAASEEKRWSEESYAKLADQIARTYKLKIVFVGDKHDAVTTERILRKMQTASLNLCGRTSLVELAVLLRRAVMFIGNDSAPAHLASYMDIPVVTLFGPQDPKKYGPWGKNGIAIRRNAGCSKCADPKATTAHSCMRGITVDDVFLSFRMTDRGVLLLDQN